MKTKTSLILLLAITMTLLSVHAQPTSIEAAQIVPNVLEIVRTSTVSNGEVANVTQARLVRDIYHNVLSLPSQPKHQICPTYVTAEYQLQFSHGASSLLKANVQQGGCLTVNLGHGDVRTANQAFWSLLGRTNVLNNAHPALDVPQGLQPKDLQAAYDLPSATAGKRQTIAIVDAYDDPKAEADLAVYRSTFGLPLCSTTNGCFKKVDEHGGTHYPAADEGWSGEIALDLAMVSATCPNCHILLVEAHSASFDDLGTGVNTAVHLKANIVSNSYGALEDAQTVKSMAHYYKHRGVIIVASAGDNGYGVQVPAAFNNVVAVGGTSLSHASTPRGWAETVWSGTGSGCSQYVGKPGWQKDKGCHKRSVTDVSAVADPATGVAVYNTYGGSGWSVFGGTSASAPIIAGVYALAGNAAKITSSYLYGHRTNLNPVTSGSNGTCSPGYLCSAVSGEYNGPTGLGTPKGLGAF
ncbi:MAG TPA: S53 family peptidase [Ktedonobacteraceae bacterium]